MVNTWLFINVPNMLVENRQTTTTYQRAFEKLGLFHPGLTLPVELDDQADTDAARDMALGSALFILCVCAAMGRRRWVAALPAALLVLAALDLTRVSVMPKSDYALTPSPNGFDVSFSQPSGAVYVQIGHSWETWFEAPDFPRVTLETKGVTGQDGRRALDVNQVIAASCESGVRDMSVVAAGSYDFAPALAAKVLVYRSRSVIRNLLLPWRGTC
jgi:hypothetical protein